MAKIVRQSFTLVPVIDTNIYADGDAMGGLLTLSDVLRDSMLSGRIESITVIDQAKQSSALEIYFFNSAVTAGTNNVAYNPSDADIAECLGVVKVVAADYNATANQSVATLKPELSFQKTAGNDLYAQVVCGGTPTYGAATELILKVVVTQD